MKVKPLCDGRGDGAEALRANAFDLGADPALILDGDGVLVAANTAAENLFGHTLALLARDRFKAALPPGAALVQLIDRTRIEGAPLRARGLGVAIFGRPSLVADATVAPLAGRAVLVTLRVRASGSDGGTDVGNLRSVIGLGRMLAHEINNPLAGIRGAAQLLKAGAAPRDIPLAQLIVDETDRIRRLVDRVEAFSDDTPPHRVAVNIHQVLDRVRALIANGVADGLTMRENYDPSLPPAWGEEDQLIQLFLNLTKNAAEAARSRGDGCGEIVLSTAFHHGARVRQPGRLAAAATPLEVSILDNGPGVSDQMRDHLFESFVTTKARGTGLGLALAVKIVNAHRGSIDFESEPGRTVFRVRLPIAPPSAREGLRP